MLKRVSNRSNMYNNRNIIARSPFLTQGKLIYYKLFAWVSFQDKNVDSVSGKLCIVAVMMIEFFC